MMDRRTFLAAKLSGLAMAAAIPGISWAAANTDKRFVFVIQRGAADGLATLAPVGDPDFIRARGDLGREALDGHKLDDLFTLHQAMMETAKLFGQREASFAHAVASGYRARSHFDAQNILESGGDKPYGRKDGWVNRLLTLLPKDKSKAVAVAPAIPLALRGSAPATSFEQSRRRGADDDLKDRVAMLYAEDAQLSAIWEDAVQTDAMAGMAEGRIRGGEAVGRMAAGLMQGPQGARVLMLDTGGWDTHSRQVNRLKNQLGQLDNLVAALRTGLGSDWKNTLVLVATEFGRTVAFNGTGGTDHGTASAAMLFGGGLKSGGTVEADWPGLKAGNLFEGRDLRSTLRFEKLVTKAVSHHYVMEPQLVRRTLFPDFA